MFSDLTEKEIELLCAIINHEGDGSHPWVTPNNVKYFALEYVNDLLDHAVNVAASSEALQKMIVSIRTKLN